MPTPSPTACLGRRAQLARSGLQPAQNARNRGSVRRRTGERKRWPTWSLAAGFGSHHSRCACGARRPSPRPCAARPWVQHRWQRFRLPGAGGPVLPYTRHGVGGDGISHAAPSDPGFVKADSGLWSDEVKGVVVGEAEASAVQALPSLLTHEGLALLVGCAEGARISCPSREPRPVLRPSFQATTPEIIGAAMRPVNSVHAVRSWILAGEWVRCAWLANERCGGKRRSAREGQGARATASAAGQGRVMAARFCL